MKATCSKVIATALAGAMVAGVPAFGFASLAQAEEAQPPAAAAVPASADAAADAASQRTTDFADGTYTIGAKSHFSMFKVYGGKAGSTRNQAKLIVRDGQAQIRFRLSGTGYDALYLGTTAEAEAAPKDQLVNFQEVNEGTDKYGIPYDFYYFQFPLSLNRGETKDIALAAHGARSGKWFSQTLTVTTDYLAAKPATVTGVKAKSTKKGQVKVSWKRLSANVQGYQVSLAQKKSFKGATTKTADGPDTSAITVKKLKRGKSYYVRVRATNSNDYSTVQGPWSKVKSVKVK